MLQVAPSAEEVAAALRDVLARPEFQPARAEPGRGLLARAVRWLLGAVQRLIPDLPALPGGPLVEALAVAALVVAGVLVARRLLRRVARRRPAPVIADPPGSETERRVERSAQEWEERARALGLAGQAREAALALYQAVLRRLADAGLVRFDPAKTPGDYRREVAGAPVEREYAAFLRRFEPIAFGRVPGDEDLPALFALARDAAPAHG